MCAVKQLGCLLAMSLCTAAFGCRTALEFRPEFHNEARLHSVDPDVLYLSLPIPRDEIKSITIDSVASYLIAPSGKQFSLSISQSPLQNSAIDCHFDVLVLESPESVKPIRLSSGKHMMVIVLDKSGKSMSYKMEFEVKKRFYNPAIEFIRNPP